MKNISFKNSKKINFIFNNDLVYTVCPLYLKPHKYFEQHQWYEKMFQTTIAWHGGRYIILTCAWPCGNFGSCYDSDITIFKWEFPFLSHIRIGDIGTFSEHYNLVSSAPFAIMI